MTTGDHATTGPLEIRSQGSIAGGSEPSGARRALVLQHHPLGPPGHLGDWAVARGIELDVRHAYDGGFHALEPGEYDLVVSLGAEESASDDEVPWLSDELTVLDRAVSSDVPVLGICFGGQSLARSLGATVAPAERWEAGWLEIETASSDFLAPGPWFFFHQDAFELPCSADELGRTSVGVAAFRYGRNLGVQFHPEATRPAIEEWMRAFGGVPEVEREHEQIQRATLRLAETGRSLAWDLFERFALEIAEIG